MDESSLIVISEIGFAISGQVFVALTDNKAALEQTMFPQKGMTATLN